MRRAGSTFRTKPRRWSRTQSKCRQTVVFSTFAAAPGGKSGLIAANAPRALIAAGDLHRSRVEFLKANLARQGCGEVSVLQYDAEATLPFGEGSFDAVLVDAPCSGTGTIRRNPEIRYSVASNDLDELPRKQLRILTNVSNLVKRGGSLVYSTCSLEREENELVAQAFTAGHPGFETVMPKMPARFITDDKCPRTWPHRDGLDGFFVAAFRRL